SLSGRRVRIYTCANSRINLFFFFSSRRRHTRYWRDWSSDVCSSDLPGDKLHAFALYPGSPAPGHVSIPPDVDLRAGAREDPAMERYLALGPEKRQNDFFLYHALDVYWLSEYRSDGVAVDFSSDFIFHLESLGPRRTRLEILEYRPRVRLGKKLAPTAHG